MSAEQNKKLIQDAFAAWRTGNARAFFNLLADDVRWTIIGATPLSRTYTSKREFIEGAVKPMGEKLTMPLLPAVLDVIADGDKVVVTWEGRSAATNGVLYNQSYCWVLKLTGGRISEGTAYLDTELVSSLWEP